MNEGFPTSTRLEVIPTVLFTKGTNFYLVGNPDCPRPWLSRNEAALDALHFVIARPGAWCHLPNSGGSNSPSAVHQRLHNAARAIAFVSPLLATEIHRGLHRKTVKCGHAARILWRYEPRGAIAFIETRPNTKERNPNGNW